MSPIAIAVALVAAERLAEVALSERNLRRLWRRGAVEHGRLQYVAIVALHTAWLGALLVVVAPQTRPDAALIALYIALQAVRVWSIASLGPWWSTRVVTVPGAPLVARGPYRYLRHPIYVVVVCEIALLPLAFGAWRLAFLATAVNVALLAWRIRLEDNVLAARRDLPA